MSLVDDQQDVAGLGVERMDGNDGLTEAPRSNEEADHLVEPLERWPTRGRRSRSFGTRPMLLPKRGGGSHRLVSGPAAWAAPRQHARGRRRPKSTPRRSEEARGRREVPPCPGRGSCGGDGSLVGWLYPRHPAIEAPAVRAAARSAKARGCPLDRRRRAAPDATQPEGGRAGRAFRREQGVELLEVIAERIRGQAPRSRQRRPSKTRRWPRSR